MNEVIESKNKLTFTINYTELNFKYYNNEYFLNKGIHAKVFIVLNQDEIKGGNNSLVTNRNVSLTIPYRYFFDYSNYINNYFYRNNTYKQSNLFMDIINRITVIGKYIGNYTEKWVEPKKEEKKDTVNPMTIENIESNITEIKPMEIKTTDEKEDNQENEFVLKTEDKQILSVDSSKKLKIEIINILKYSRISEEEEAENYIKMYNIFKEKKGKIYNGEVYHYMVDGEVIVIGNIEKECEGLCNMEFEEEELKEIENTLFYKEIHYYLK